MPHWREELIEAAKSRAEREAEEQERQRLRVEEALVTAHAAYKLAATALQFVTEKLTEKGQPARLVEQERSLKLSLHDASLALELDPATAILRVTFAEAKPREFDFAKDRHIAAADIEEYVGRRSVELVRSAQKSAPW